MKKLLAMITLFIGVISATNAQTTKGDLWEGLTKKVTYDRMIPPYGLEVTFNKTVHIIFPSALKYVDLGSNLIIAGKADGAENVLRIKASIRNFEKETNLTAITEDGNFFTFNIKYADEPEKLNIEMKDFIHDGSTVNRPNNAMDIYLKELGSESPMLVKLIMKSIYNNNDKDVKGIDSKKFNVEHRLKGIFTHNGLLYFHTEIRNLSNVPYDIDYLTFKIVDKKVAKRTAIQEQVIYPLRSFNDVTQVGGGSSERSVFTLEKFTIPDDKKLVVEMHEKNGGRHQSFTVQNSDLLKAKTIKNLKIN